MGDVIHSNWPRFLTVKAVRWLSSSWIGICQNPEVRSIVVKMLLPARPMSAMHSETSFMEYLSVLVFKLSPRKSWTILNPWPFFLGTQKMGELYMERVLRTTPSLSQSSRVFSMKA